MYVMIEENPNCPTDERVFSESGRSKIVEKLNVETPSGSRGWCDVIGVGAGAKFEPAQAVQVEDSGAGNAWLVFGGAWGLRFRSGNINEDWSISHPQQWGLPFIVLDISGEDIRFKSS